MLRNRSVSISLQSLVLAGSLFFVYSGSGDLQAKDSTVVNVAPGFSGGAEAGRKITLSSYKGTPVILIFAPSPKDPSFRSQMSEFRGRYERMASQGMIFFAAFTQEGGRIPSNIPFVLVDNPAATASAYGVTSGFAIAVIGRDGNLDCLSTRPLPGQRVLDLSLNNAFVQEQIRR